MFFIGLKILSNFILYFLSNAIPMSATSLNCISMKNQECKTRPQVVNVNNNNAIFDPFSIKTSKCSGSCNNINSPYLYVFLMFKRFKR